LGKGKKSKQNPSKKKGNKNTANLETVKIKKGKKK